MPFVQRDLVDAFRVNAGNHHLSVEIWSEMSPKDQQNIMEHMKNLNPSFFLFTWHPGDCDQFQKLPQISVAQWLVNQKQCVMHIACRLFDSKDQAKKIVDAVKEIGVKNLLALRGSSMMYPDDSTRDFPYALDFVKFLRKEYGDYFNIGVSGYPIGHPASPDPVKDIAYLKEKVDAGADFVFCQAVFDVETFKIFYKRCREIGIDVPIIPGVYALNDNNVLAGVKGFCKIIPEEYTKFFEEHKDDKEALTKFSTQYISKLITGLMKEQEISIPGVHVFCFNNFSLVEKIFHSLDYEDLKIQKPSNSLNSKC